VTAYTDPAMFNAGLTAMSTNANKVFIDTSQPTTYTAASSTYLCGTATPGGAGATVGAPGNDAGTGQEVTVAAISSGGAISATATAAFWGVAYSTGSILYAGNSLSSSQSVTNGNAFTLASFTIDLRGAT